MLTHINSTTFKAALNSSIMEMRDNFRQILLIYDDVLLTEAIRFIVEDSINAKLS